MRSLLNACALYGFLLGLPVPVFSIIAETAVSGRQFAPSLYWDRPIHLVFLLYPALSAAVFGWFGAGMARAERRLADLLAELERQRNWSMDAGKVAVERGHNKVRFLADVVHDLKTPLLAVRGFIEAVLDGRRGPVAEGQRGDLEAAARNVERLQKMVDELLEFERIDSGGYKPVAAEFDLAALAREVMEGFKPQMEAKRLTFHSQLPKRLAVLGDRDGIGRVLMNLFSNAIKFSPVGAPVGIGASVGEEDGQVLIIVWDRGPGIHTAAQKYLFTRFWRAEGASRRGQGGTGLGLAIVKGILDAHGSTIRIVSAENQGTAVHFTLPLAETGVGKDTSP